MPQFFMINWDSSKKIKIPRNLKFYNLFKSLTNSRNFFKLLYIKRRGLILPKILNLVKRLFAYCSQKIIRFWYEINILIYIRKNIQFINMHYILRPDIHQTNLAWKKNAQSRGLWYIQFIALHHSVIMIV